MSALIVFCLDYFLLCIRLLLILAHSFLYIDIHIIKIEIKVNMLRVYPILFKRFLDSLTINT